MTFYAYPIEWTFFFLSLLGLMIHSAGIWDATITYRHLRQSPDGDLMFLRIIAWSAIKTSIIRWLQILAIFLISLDSVLEPPPHPVADLLAMTVVPAGLNSTVYLYLIFVSALSVTKEITAMIDRTRSWADYVETRAKNQQAL